MFDSLWSKSISKKNKITFSNKSNDSLQGSNHFALLYWEEHCLECAPPYCYNNCLLYSPKPDTSCARLVYGMQKNNRFSGIFNYGIQVTFKKWAKIESFYTPIFHSSFQLKILDYLNKLFIKAAVLIHLLSFKNNNKSFSVLAGLRKKILINRAHRKGKEPDSFFMECYFPGRTSFNLRIRIDYKNKLLYENSFKIEHGWNNYQVSFTKLNLNKDSIGARIFIYPENDKTPTLVFTYLDFIKNKRNKVITDTKKIKCIVWDLDNTLWQGTLIESEESKLQLNAKAVEIIKEMDRNGIVNSISSKNSFDETWKVLEHFNIAEYFVCPQINWGAKSNNIKKIAKDLNIGIDSIAFIDDNIRERKEVASVVPEVRVYSENDIYTILDKPEFNNLQDTMGAQRRLSYQADIKRFDVQKDFTNNIEFLKSIQLQMSMFQPYSKQAKQRCFELIQRSNQLNLSTYRYSENEFNELLTSDEYSCFCFQCEDKFGDYGIVGFISLKLQYPDLVIQDVVISCRIAQKGVENALMFSIAKQYASLGFQSIKARLFKTKKNAPLAQIFSNLPFKIIKELSSEIHYELNDLNKIEDEQIVKTSILKSQL